MKRSLAIVAADEVAQPKLRQAFKGRAAVITLGCAKNHVDSEVMLGVLRQSGFEVVPSASDADIAVINTCGFLQSAVKESIDCILEVAKLKKQGRLRKLIVAGCMVQRYGGELEKAIPEVDCFVGVDQLLKVGAVADGSEITQLLQEGSRPYFLYDDSMPRIVATKSHTAYVKIAEGCDRPCSFCIIPKLRGSMRSREIDSVLREVYSLGRQGVREVNLVAQDLTAFGADLRKAGQADADLVSLLRLLDRERVIPWIRLLYAYPLGTTDRLLDAIVELPSVCKYLDFPLQHVSEPVLRGMRRPLGDFAPQKLVQRITTRYPQIALRTTFIVGFPGETEEQVDELERFILEGHFSSVGVFTYSAEEGTASFALPGSIPEKIKRERMKRLMSAQQTVVARRLTSLVGSKLEVLVEGPHEESDLLISARTRFQAPEVDGAVLINDIETPNAPVAGDLGEVRISEVLGYDLVGTWVSGVGSEERVEVKA